MNAGMARTTKDTPRAEAQRERILCAAQRCFIEYGFHAASMASIAETAQMSAGLMYRYFENKSAIVLAIIERELQEGRTQIAQLHSSSELAAALYDVFTRWQVRDPSVMNAALFLEMSAEATRDPQIAAALRKLYASHWKVDSYLRLLVNSDTLERVKRGDAPEAIGRICGATKNSRAAYDLYSSGAPA